MQKKTDTHWMQHAITLAKQAEKQGEVPVGAVVVYDDQIIGEGFNQPIKTCDPTAHAEMIALRAAAKHKKNYRLNNATLYVTLEPCAMCVGAIIHARIARVVFGAWDKKAGAVRSVFKLIDEPRQTHLTQWEGDVLADDCADLLKNFFQKRRFKS